MATAEFDDGCMRLHQDVDGKEWITFFNDDGVVFHLPNSGFLPLLGLITKSDTVNISLEEKSSTLPEMD